MERVKVGFYLAVMAVVVVMVLMYMGILGGTQDSLNYYDMMGIRKV